MRVYFFPKWLIQAVLIGLCALLAAGVLWSFLGGDDAAVMANPVYQGTNTEKKVALAINVDWGEDILPEMLVTVLILYIPAVYQAVGQVKRQACA